MADLLIKGLEMPKGDLALWISVHKDGTVEYIDSNKYEGYKTLRNAAVTVPPHGPLIDAEEFFRKVHHDTPLSEVFEKTIKRYIVNCPTVIPASEEVDNGTV